VRMNYREAVTKSMVLGGAIPLPQGQHMNSSPWITREM
jgi:hypothetical protein